MGKSPSFSLSDIEQPQHVKSANILEQLKIDDVVQITFSNPYIDSDDPTCYRSVSVYNYEESHLASSKHYRVSNIISHPDFEKFGLRIITMIDVEHPNPSNHIDAWVVTTDGYIRESEHFGLMYKIDSITKK
jgi:hypothetical protein